MNAAASRSSTPVPHNRSKTGVSIWNAPIELANTIYTIAYVALVLGAITTAIATMSLFWASAVRDKFADTEIQIAKTIAATANERSGEAHASVAAATERGNRLALEAEQARAEQERLKVDLAKEQIERLKFEAQFAWRVFSPEHRDRLVAALSASPGTVQIGFVASDPEATSFALQFEKIFIAAKWQVGTSANTYSASLFFGVFVPDSSAPATNDIRSAFTSVNIGFSVEKPPPISMSYGSGGGSGATLVIGSKPTAAVVEMLRTTLGATPR